jgi:hypothetical protein
MAEKAKRSGAGTYRMSHRVAAWTAWFLWMLTVVFSSLSLLMPTAQYPPNFLLPLGVMMVAYSTVGAIIVSRRSGNAIGWILCAIGFLFAFNNFSGLYAFRTIVAHPDSLPAGQAAAWFAAWVVGPAWGLFPFLLLLFPNGRPLSERWRPLLWFGGVLVTLAILTGMIYSGPISFGAVRNPLGIDAVEELNTFVGNLGFYLFTVLMLLSIVSVYLRFRRASGTERQQIKWLAYAAALVGVLIIVDVVSDLLLGGFGWWFDVVLIVALLSLPLSIGVAVLRYRLYDIDRVINRTIVYGVLTATLEQSTSGASQCCSASSSLSPARSPRWP